jgi:hypothetical protein
MITRQATIYETEDGRVWLDHDEAKRHERRFHLERFLTAKLGLSSSDCQEVASFVNEEWANIRTIMEGE